MEIIQQRSSLTNYCIGLSISESPDLAALKLGEIHLPYISLVVANPGFFHDIFVEYAYLTHLMQKSRIVKCLQNGRFQNSKITILQQAKCTLQDAMFEFARYLLASGASLAYGGDLRAGGFTETLFKLVQANNQQGLPPYKRIMNFLAWPIHLTSTTEQKAELKGVADFKPLAPPADLTIDPKTFLPPNSPENSYIWARCLTAMREEMTRKTSARLLLGGRLIGYKGKYPGLIEEAAICLRAEKPLFLIGGFGGCPKAVIDAMHGEHPEVLTTAYQIVQNPGYEEFMTYYNDQVKHHPELNQEPIDYNTLVAFFQQKGVAGLNNGLSLEENERLFVTPHIPEMISLVLKGLSRLSGTR